MSNTNKSEIYNNYYWLAERNGIAIASLDQQFNITLNSHAMLIFGVDNCSIELSDLDKAIKDIEGFENYLKSITNHTSEYYLMVLSGKIEKRYLVSGILSQIDKTINLSIQTLNSDQNNAEYLCQYAIHSSDAFLLWDTNDQLLYINKNYENLFERDRDDLGNNPFKIYDWIHPEDAENIKPSFDSLNNSENDLYPQEFRVLMPTGKIKWFYYLRKAFYDGAGKIYRYIGVYTDITKRKEIEQELIFSKTSLDQNFTPIFWLNKEGAIVYTNIAACKKLEYSHQEFLTKTVFDIDEIEPIIWPKLWNKLKEKKTDRVQSHHIKKDGTKYPVEIIASFLEFNKEEFVFAYVLDITDRKNIENKINYSQEFDRLLLNISKRFINISINEVNASINLALQEICDFTNSSSAHIYLYNKDLKSIQLTHFYSQVASKINDESLKVIPISADTWHFRKLSKEKTVSVPYITDIPDGEDIKQHCINVEIGSFIDIALLYQNKIQGFFGLTSKKEGKTWDNDEIQLLQIIGDMFTNTLQRRDFMNELLDSEQNYREIYNATSEAIFIHNSETGAIEDVNDAMLKMYGYTYEKALSCEIKDLGADISYQSEIDPIQVTLDALKKPQVFEWLAKKSDGTTFWTEVTLRKAEIHGDDKIIAVIRDISDRRKAEKLLRENETKYRMLVEGQSDLIVKIDNTRKLLFVSPSFENAFTHINSDMLDRDYLNFVQEEDKELVSIAMDKLNRKPHTCFFEYRTETTEGLRWYAWNFTGIQDDKEEISEFIGVGRDITYQKMVESALRESEERFRSIVQNLSDVVFLLDEKANIKYVTPSCEEYLGMKIEELLGNNIYNLIHNDDVWLAEENITLHLEGSDYSLPYELKLKHTTENWKVFEAKSQNLLNHTAVNSIIFTISDITERKLMEKQVLDAIIKTEEKERERFAKDLHDDLGPLLSSIKMYVGMLIKVEQKEKQEFIIKNLQDIIKEAIATTKEVSNDLNPHVLNNYGLISALKLFINKIANETTIELVEEINDSRYSAAIELSLYRIAKELINNSLKHAEASNIYLNIYEKIGSLALEFKDDGKGLPEEALKANKPGGMGLSNIMSRAKSLNAKYTFYTNLEKGFKFEILVPLVQD